MKLNEIKYNVLFFGGLSKAKCPMIKIPKYKLSSQGTRSCSCRI